MKLPAVKLPAVKLAPRYQLLVGITGGLVLAVWAIRFLYLPLLGRIAEHRVRLRDLAVKIEDARVLTAQLPQQQAALQQAGATFQSAYGRVGDGQSVARILESLSLQAKGYQLGLTAAQPRTADDQSVPIIMGPELALREVPLTLQLKGRYQQMGEFLGWISDGPFVASVRRVSIRKPQADSVQLEADLVIAAYLAERPSQ